MPDRAPPHDDSLADALLSERVLYPVLGLVLVLVVAFVVVRHKNLGPAPDLDLAVITDAGELGDAHVRLRDLRGKVVVLDFWATWCGPCRAMTPVLVSLHRRFNARGVRVVGVNVDESGPSVVPAFRRRFGMEYPVVYDLGGAASQRYGVEGLPTLVVIDRDGNVRLRHAGTASESELAGAIEGAL